MRRPALVILLLLAGAAACSEPPQKEIDQAQTAIDAAKNAGADVYAAEEYTAATAALDKARASVDQRDYRQALSYAIDARQRASDAARQTIDARARAKRDAEKLVTACSARITQLDTGLKVADGARAPARDLRAPRAALADAGNALQETRGLMDAGKYQEVVTKLAEVRKNLDTAIAAVDAVRERPARRRK